MRREASETAAEAAHRRLELIARELEEAGIGRVPYAPSDDGAEEVEPAGPEPEGVQPAGRHLRRQERPVAAGDRVGGWVDDRLPLPLRGRLHLGTRELVLVVLVTAAGLVIAAVTVLRSSAGEVTAPSPIPTGALLTPAAAASTAPVEVSASPTASGSPAAMVVVDVAGKVRRPGVVRLPAGARVVDALRRAGGARRDADLTSINLAAVLTDGQQIVVGAPGRADVAGTGAGTGTSDGGDAAGPLLDLNAASEQELEGLPGVGPVTAQKILEWRTAHGVFSSLDELLEVDGIGPKTLADLAPHLTL